MDGIPLSSSYMWTQARALGVTRGQIRADGIPISRGLYLSRSADRDLHTLCRAWMRVLPPDAAFGFSTAAALHGAGAGGRTPVHVVLRPRSVLPQRTGLRVHARRLADEDVVDVGGLRVTSGPQTFLDMAAVLQPADLLALGDALARRERLDGNELALRLARAHRVRGVVRARDWAPHVTAHAASHAESVMRYWLLISDLPSPQVQVPVRDRRGRTVAHADLGYAEWKVALEYEGLQHAERNQFGRDIDRYSLMAADGWLVLRFAARHTAGGFAIVDRTRRALLSRGWRPERG
jgi:very-short-patch-repair endonuclease